MLRLAAIDVGTNTLRLLVGEPDGAGGYRPIFAAQEITRLGQGLLPARQLQPAAVQRTVAVLRAFREAAASHGATEVTAVGTSALREAKNREAFLVQVGREAGLAIRVISGQEEARLTLLGVRAALAGAPSDLLVMDIGGGSTEFLLAHGPAIRATVSTGLGAVKLSEAHLRADPPRPEELEAVRRAVAARLARLKAQELPDLGPATPCVGTAGSVTSLAAVDLRLDPYDPDRVTGHRLDRDRVAALARELAALPLVRRRRIPGLEPARADVIVAGALICLGALDVLGLPHLTVSDGGLREGILLDRLARAEAGPHAGKLDNQGVIC